MSTLPLRTRSPAAAWRLPQLQFAASVERVLLAAALFWLATASAPFFAAALQGRDPGSADTWSLAAALTVALPSAHFLLLAPLANRWTVKPLLALLFVGTAFALHFMTHYGVYLDPTMLRNAWQTNLSEAGELLTWSMLPTLLLLGVLPTVVLTRVRIVHRPWPRAFGVRLGSILLALLMLAGSVLAVFQPLSSLLRNHKEVRYLVTPANYLWSLGAVGASQARGAAGPRRPIGLDAQLAPAGVGRTRPAVLVLVVGETARAANWGLSGYARQTTPELARLPVVNVPRVATCGTDTESSVPCLFAPVGRRAYDEAAIRGSESLLHVLAHAGVGVQWRDNQSGCKGVCEGLPSDTIAATGPSAQCEGGHCLDEGLLQGLEGRLQQATGVQLLVLHQLGNHGPSYFRRYPVEFARFQPACEHDDLRLCSREQIVNAYDNALLYTDHVLAQLIGRLSASGVDAAVIYVSDHGESLGESGLFLHGIPHAIAPREQTEVPMTMWFSDGFARAAALDVGCLRQRAAQGAAHDHLFHTVLGLLDVQTALYEPAWDLTQSCRAH